MQLPTTDNTTCGTTPYGASAPCPTVAGSSEYLQSYLSNALLTQAWSLGGGFINQSHGVPDWCVLTAASRAPSCVACVQVCIM